PSTENNFKKWIYENEPEYKIVEHKISETYSELIDGEKTGRFYNIDGGLPEDKFPQLKKGLRYCPGDRFFAEHGVIPEIPATESGKAKSTVMEEIITKMENSEVK
ncbi:MAG: hypothetical protein WC389_16800, partial [Lutibacter sp.]